MVMVIAPLGWVPLAEYWPMGPLLLCVTRLFHPLWLRPLFIPIPGMILMSSAASRPCMGNSLTIRPFSVWRPSPLSTGEIASAEATTWTSDAMPPTWRAMAGNALCSPRLNTMFFCSHTANPRAEMLTV